MREFWREYTSTSGNAQSMQACARSQITFPLPPLTSRAFASLFSWKEAGEQSKSAFLGSVTEMQGIGFGSIQQQQQRRAAAQVRRTRNSTTTRLGFVGDERVPAVSSRAGASSRRHQVQEQVQEQEQAATWGRRLNMNQGPQMMRRLPVSVSSPIIILNSEDLDLFNY